MGTSIMKNLLPLVQTILVCFVIKNVNGKNFMPTIGSLSDLPDNDGKMNQLVLQQELHRNPMVDVKNLTRVIGEVHVRDKRALAFPFLSTAGIICAVAIPLPNPSVFFSYNFEANYNLPYQGSDFTTGIANRLDLIDPARKFPGDAPTINGTTSEHTPTDRTKRSVQKSLITRKRFYKTFEDRLNSVGLDGRKCLLRTICEVSELPVHENNGLVGDIFHIFFTPSSSKHENLPSEFYKAEELGASGDCSKYLKYCRESILDLMSTIIQH